MCVSTFCDVIYLEEPHIYKYYQNHSNNIAAPNDTDIDYYPTMLYYCTLAASFK
jgi:hypothetical protein